MNAHARQVAGCQNRATVFADPMAVYLDDGSGTGSMVVIGISLRENLLYVVHVERGERQDHQREAGHDERTIGLRQRRLVMSTAARKRGTPGAEPVRVLGRGLRARRGVHLTIRAVREAVGKTQVDVAADAAMDQSDVSRLEGRGDFEDCLVSTLRRYIAALGGELELVAAFGDRRIILTGSQSSIEGAPAKKALRRPARR